MIHTPLAESGPAAYHPWLVVAGVLALASLWFVWTAWRDHGPGDGVFLALLRRTNSLYVRIAHGIRPPAVDPLPASGPAIVVANHRSGIDPLALNACTRRRIRFLIAREYHRIPLLATIFRQIELIPVNRDGTDLAATRQALRALRNGHVIGIFPEGGIREKIEDSTSAVDSPGDGFKDGASLLALRSGAPIIPAYVSGTPPNDSVLAAFFTPSRSRVAFGTPLLLPRPSGAKPSKDELREGTRGIVARILALRSGLDGGAGRQNAEETEVLTRTES